MPTQLYTTTATGGDDFLILTGGDQTADGGEGDDLILGDSTLPFQAGTTTSMASPFSIDNPLAWTIQENPFFQNASHPHTSLYVRTDGASMHYASVTVGAGERLTIDIDFGAFSSIGISTDVIVEVYDEFGELVASNDDGTLTFDDGDEGSSSGADPFLQFTNTGGAEAVYTIRFREFGGDNLFEMATRSSRISLLPAMTMAPVWGQAMTR
ncbi:hypothetical protein H8M03_03945 [Sphingomonas sabuli]|uniref:Uncharacterized protein n=1 Tax=Sphingomonas sabuli TaxID=2764186 RepID=A0A7G9L4E8_9SPHN|nr:hypothetical protein [Sphingomonas sabuli]QNM83497.1 hypothetical protein H8M03_03945 [Sphingomonas sabuli]